MAHLPTPGAPRPAQDPPRIDPSCRRTSRDNESIRTNNETTAAAISSPEPLDRTDLLVIDDDSRICRLIERVAEEMGLSARTLTASRNISHEDTTFSGGLVLLDLGMPGLDGVEVLRRFAASRCSARICLISGTAPKLLESTRVLGLELGLDMASPLAKPLDLNSLRGTFETLLDTRRPNLPDAEDLAAALDAGEVEPHYQPQIDLETGDLVGIEVLARWRSQRFGAVPPSIFIPLAERSGLMDPLTRHLSRRAMLEIAELGGDAKVCINLSPVLLDDLRYPDLMEQWASEAGIEPDRVTFEITESEAMRDPTNCMDILIRFRLKGFHLSIDDFGTGFSSLDHLYRLPFEELKIDRGFVRDLRTREEAAVIVRAMLALAEGFGMRTVAEGVEDRETADLLRRLGCQSGQGYLYSRALPIAQLRAYEANRRDTRSSSSG